MKGGYKRPLGLLILFAGIIAWLSRPGPMDGPEEDRDAIDIEAAKDAILARAKAKDDHDVGREKHAEEVAKRNKEFNADAKDFAAAGDTEAPPVPMGDTRHEVDKGDGTNGNGGPAGVEPETPIDPNSCEPDLVKAAKNQLWFTGPPQQTWKEDRMNMRCFQGQHYEDLFMFQHYLANVGGGFFIELGALDGFSYSVTYFFEKYLRWDGLLIEASPLNHKLYQSKMRKLKKRRRHVPFVQAAACGEPKPMTYVAKEGTGAGIFEFLPKVEQDRVMKEGCERVTNITEFEPDKMGKNACALIPIKCVHLGDELRRRKVTHIDMFVLDVQGAELNVIQTMRLQEIPVRYFIIELDETAPEKDAQVRCILRKNGYVPIGRLDVNELWTKKDFDVKKYASSYKKPDPSTWGRCFKDTTDKGPPSKWITAPKFDLDQD